MAYITPRVQIQQEFEQLPVYSSKALSAFIIGPHYHLARYSEKTEKSTTALATFNGVAVNTGNAYQYLADTSYDIPNVPVGGTVDSTYTKVFAENVVAKYFPHPDFPLQANASKVSLVPIGNDYYTNRVRFDNINLVSNASGNRASYFSGRDVAVGDYVDVFGGGGSTVRARITRLIPDISPSVIDNAVAGSSNKATAIRSQGIPAHVNGTGSTANTSIASVTAGAAYFGYASKGITSDTYTIEVTAPGNLIQARFSVRSANNAFAVKELLQLDGSGILTLDNSVESIGTNSVKVDFTGSTSFTVGTKWTVNVQAAVVASTPTQSGTYTGASDMTYTIVVERGGAFYNDSNATTCARLVITGSDLDTQTVVLPKRDTPFSIGSYGVIAKFATGSLDDGTLGALVLGDVYRISATASKATVVKTVELSETVTTPQIRASLNSLTANLYLPQAVVQVGALRDQFAGTSNWVQSANTIQINAGLTTFDSLIVSGATPSKLDVVKADLFVEHRDLLQDNAQAIDYVESPSDIANKLNVVHPDNPLAQGVYDAILNSANERVYFLAVGTDDLAGYLDALKIAEKSDNVYSFVPMTFDRDVQEAVVAHVNAFSTPEVARWRIAWLSVKDEPSAVTYSKKSDNTIYKAKVEDDPQALGTSFTYVTVAGADFLEKDSYGANKLRANDTLRINFRVGPDGATIYDEYTVSSVLSNTTFLISTPTPQAYSSEVKIELVRNYTKAERARNIAAIGGSYNNRRVRVVFPDTYKNKDGVSKPGYVAAAGLAGLRSGVVPHQGLTNSEFLGAYDLSKVVIEYTQSDLDLMAAAGIWIISQSVIGATAYVRHQLTTDETNLNTSEDSITTNVDSMSYALRDVLAPFIGRYNINNENLTVIRAAISAEMNYRATGTFTTRAGNQLTSFSASDILSLEVDPVSKDKINVEVRLRLPYPLNYLNLKLIGGA